MQNLPVIIGPAGRAIAVSIDIRGQAGGNIGGKQLPRKELPHNAPDRTAIRNAKPSKKPVGYSMGAGCIWRFPLLAGSGGG